MAFLTRLFLIELYLYAMNIFRLAFELFALYIVYKIVFDFIIPIAQTTKQVKKQFGEMNSRMQNQASQATQQNTNYSNTTSAQPTNSSKDYIEFEEVK